MKTPVSKSNVFNTVPALNISRDFCVLQIILSPTYIARLCFYLCLRIISIFQKRDTRNVLWEWCGREVWQLHKKGQREMPDSLQKCLWYPWVPVLTNTGRLVWFFLANWYIYSNKLYCLHFPHCSFPICGMPSPEMLANCPQRCQVKAIQFTFPELLWIVLLTDFLL